MLRAFIIALLLSSPAFAGSWSPAGELFPGRAAVFSWSGGDSGDQPTIDTTRCRVLSATTDTTGATVDWYLVSTETTATAAGTQIGTYGSSVVRQPTDVGVGPYFLRPKVTSAGSGGTVTWRCTGFTFQRIGGGEVALAGTSNPNSATSCSSLNQFYVDTDGDVTVKPSGPVLYRSTALGTPCTWQALNTHDSKEVSCSDVTPTNFAEVSVRSNSWCDESIEGMDAALRRQLIGPVGASVTAVLTADATCMRRNNTPTSCLNDATSNNRHDTTLQVYGLLGGAMKYAGAICTFSTIGTTGFDAGDHWIWCPYELDHPGDGSDIALATGNDCVTVALASDCVSAGNPYAACTAASTCPTCVGPTSDGTMIAKPLSSPVAFSDNPSDVVMALEATADTGTPVSYTVACSILVD